jgi:hypothetical protein
MITSDGFVSMYGHIENIIYRDKCFQQELLYRMFAMGAEVDDN